MKRNIIDATIGFFFPDIEAKRIHFRALAEFKRRSYDAAKTFNTDDWTSATKGSANSEISLAQSVLREKGRDAVRNNPYAGRGLSAIVSNTVGAGIIPNIKGKSARQVSQVNTAWKEWAETTLCDSQGNLNFYAMQALAMRSTVESGEVIIVKELSNEKHSLKLVESDYIVESTIVPDKSGNQIIQGVKVDKNGKTLAYLIHKSHPAEQGDTSFLSLDRELVCHVRRIDRPGQVRGVSWFHPVIRQLSDFNEYQTNTLINKKLSATFSAFVTAPESESLLSSSDLIAKRELDSHLTPGSIRYLGAGESVSFASPPPTTGYDEYCRQTLRAIASGIGTTYEALTSDYSQVNFSSGRMGHLEFRRNCEMWRWGMLIPQFCEPAFQHFLQWCQLKKGIVVDGVSCEWVPPAWQMIDPAKEIAAIQDAIRAGLTSLPKAIKEQGYDPIDLMQEISESNKELDRLGIQLDSDPRKLTKAGIVQIDPSQFNNSGESKSEDSKKVSTDGES